MTYFVKCDTCGQPIEPETPAIEISALLIVGIATPQAQQQATRIQHFHATESCYPLTLPARPAPVPPPASL